MASNKFLEEQGLSRLWAHVKKLVADSAQNRNQLLINNDFQINQRGQSEYNFNEQGHYGLDMWQHRQGNYYEAIKVSQIKGGGCHVKLNTNTGAGLRQYLEEDSFKVGAKYTTAISIDGVVYKGTKELIVATDNVIIENDIFKLSFYQSQEKGKVIYSIWFKIGKTEHDINYCDLFEGDIAYPHVKEDKSIALMRCLPYCEYGEFSVYYGNNTYFIPGFTYKCEKVSTPQIIFIKSVADESGTVSGTFESVSQNKWSAPFIRYNDSSAVGLGNKTLNMRVLITCEQL